MLPSPVPPMDRILLYLVKVPKLPLHSSGVHLCICALSKAISLKQSLNLAHLCCNFESK